ncbi:MAG: hypothetical protein AB1Z67_07550 [Candidatus Limnocylindrales bacterium]
MTTHLGDVSGAVDVPVADPIKTNGVMGMSRPDPTSTPDRPLDGGRGALATQGRSLRRLEARALGERRQSGDDLLEDVITAAPSPAFEGIEDEIGGQSLASRLHATIDAVLRRSGRARHR